MAERERRDSDRDADRRPSDRNRDPEKEASGADLSAAGTGPESRRDDVSISDLSAAGETDFDGADLSGTDLGGAGLSGLELGDDEEVDPAGIIVPEYKEGAEEGDPAAVVWPEFQEGPENVAAETEELNGPGDEGVERPIWKESGPTERESVPDTDVAGIDVGPVFREGSDDEEVDPAGIIVPEYKEGAEEGDHETEDADWADEDVEMDVDVDTFEEVDIDDEEMER